MTEEEYIEDYKNVFIDSINYKIFNTFIDSGKLSYRFSSIVHDKKVVKEMQKKLFLKQLKNKLQEIDGYTFKDKLDIVKLDCFSTIVNIIYLKN